MSDESPISKAAQIEPLSLLWRILAAPQTLMLLLGLLAVVLALSTLVPQIPTQALGNPDAWLATQSGLFAGGNGLLRALGLFDLYDAFWFRLLLALIVVTLAVWTGESADLAWHATGNSGFKPGDLALWGRSAPRVRFVSPLPPEETQADLGEALSRHGYRWQSLRGTIALNLVAGRRAFALWARPAACAATLLALAGAMVAAASGWQSEEWKPVAGESLAVGHGSSAAVRLDRLGLPLDVDGRTGQVRSTVSWLEAGREGSTAVGEDTVEPGQPARRRGVALRLLGYVPAVSLRGVDAAGRSLAFQAQDGVGQLGASGETQVIFSSPEDRPLLYVSDQDLFLALAYDSAAAAGPVVHLDLVRGSGEGRRRIGSIRQSGSIAVDGLRIDAELSYRPVLRLDHRPGLGLGLAAAALALLSLIAGQIAAPQLAWIAVGPGEEGSSLVQILPLPHAGAEGWAGQLAEQLRGELNDGA